MLRSFVLLLSNFIFILNRYVDARQWQRFKLRKPQKLIVDLYGFEKVEKSYLYSLDKLFLSVCASLIMQVSDNIFIQFNIMRWLWEISFKFSTVYLRSYSELAASCVFISLLGTISQVLSLPAGIYSTFYIEKKHGFNNQDWYSFTQDIFKGWILSLIIGIPFVAGLIKVIEIFGSWLVPAACAFTFVVQIGLVLIMPTYIQPLFNKFEILPDGELKNEIEKLSKKLNFPLKEIYVMDGSKRSSHSNAYFFGLFGSKRIQANTNEICAILGHELGHWSLGHIWKRLLLSQSQIIPVFVAFYYVVSSPYFYNAFGFTTSRPTVIGLILVQQLLAPIFVLSGCAANIISRVHEYEADQFAVKLGYGKHLKEGLIKIHVENLSNPDPDRLYSVVHFSHPTLCQRLEEIDKTMKKY